MKDVQQQLNEFAKRYFENVRNRRVKAANEIHQKHKTLMFKQLRREIKLERRA